MALVYRKYHFYLSVIRWVLSILYNA